MFFFQKLSLFALRNIAMKTQSTKKPHFGDELKCGFSLAKNANFNRNRVRGCNYSSEGVQFAVRGGAFLI